VKLSKLDINFYKVVIGVGFSLLWARVMYLVWQQPSFTNFVWFYLLVGSVILKWVIFEIVDIGCQIITPFVFVESLVTIIA